MIKRQLHQELINLLFKGKAILIFGARQVGKTSLIKSIVKNQSFVWLNGDEPDIQILLENITSDRLKAIVGTHQILIIDEAQMIHNIGLLIKRMVDNFPEIQVIASGSSAFELADKTKESMVGRKEELQLYPITFSEMVTHTNFIEESRLMPHRLIYGYYDLGINRLTVEKYIDILEKNFIIFSLNAFSRNQDNELKKGRKVYFWDLGLRNRIIKNFKPIEFRDDVGAIWENFIISERKKKLAYNDDFCDTYFWRNTQQAEIDYLEIKNQDIDVYEIKYNPNKKVIFTKSFTNKYHPKNTQVIHNQNYWEFIM